MLMRLTVQNFAIIEDLSVDFKSGMTVLTGQTGAGKSLIIDSISLLLGSRADADMIRYGSDKAFIEGSFKYSNEKISKYLEEYSIPYMDNIVTIRREIQSNTRNTIKINGTTVSLVILKNIASYLADIHVQHDTYRLINPETYLGLIDPINDAEFDKIFNQYCLLLRKYQDKKKLYEDILSGKKNSLEKLEYLTFQREEIASLNLQKDEDSLLEEQINKLKNFDKIFNSLKNCYLSLEGEDYSLDKIYEAYDYLSKISAFDVKYEETASKISDCYYILDEIKHEIRRNLDHLDFDEEELNYLTERLVQITKLKDKYHMSCNDLITYLEKISLEIDLVTNYDEVLKEKELELKTAYDNLVISSKNLTNYRKKISLEIEKIIMKECWELDLPDTQFKISFNDTNFDNYLNASAFKNNGVDEIDFLISLNKGEPLKPLHKTASGGEMSRIMLAFKVYFNQKTQLSLMVFDEIDTGISGTTAMQIAKKMKMISASTQVLCITHLPQVASIGDYHIYIYKTDDTGRTKTNILYLDEDGRIESLARMLSGNQISKFALEHAKEMLEESKKIQQK